MLTAEEIERIPIKRRYRPAGPVLRAFHADDHQYRALLGPFGSGKSVACVAEILRLSSRFDVVIDGVRRVRWGVIRSTYGELKTTTIKTWLEWVDSDIVYDHPIRSTYSAALQDGTQLEMEMLFASLDKPRDLRKLLSMELTGVWVNEGREVPKLLVTAAFDRTGRYPRKQDWESGDRKRWLLLDTNYPEEETWLWEFAERTKPANWAFFHQPGGLVKRILPTGEVRYYANPAAENIEHLPAGYNYYMDMIPGRDSDYIAVYALAQYGSIFTGRPVYGESFIERLHVAVEPLGVYRGLPLYFGWDFGLTPAAIAFQLTPRGQVRVLREYCCDDGGIRQFCTREVLPALARDFPGMTFRSWGDPAGRERAQGDSEITAIGELTALGFNAAPAPSNDFPIRRDAVLAPLRRLIDGEPGLVIDPSCKRLIKGFRGGYRFTRILVSGGGEKFRDVPEKDVYSHPHDALQYGLLGAMSPEGTVSKRAQSLSLPPAGGGYAGAV